MNKAMSIYPEPPKPKSAVRKAGRAVAQRCATSHDLALVDQWRASHGYVLNTFQMLVKRRLERTKVKAEFAQRLKRRQTVIDKLQRRKGDNSFLMADVTTMHDLAGCRLVFDDLSSLENFRHQFNNVLGTVNHKLRNDPAKYNYIAAPKSTGYRGIHDIYAHFPRPHKRDDLGSLPWHGLLIEIQYRTITQHAWATAVELSDFIDNQRTKFVTDTGVSTAERERVRFFALCSELLARSYEDCLGPLPDLPLDQVRAEINLIEAKLRILERLKTVSAASDKALGRHNVLYFQESDDPMNEVEVLVFTNSGDAILRANELENDNAIFGAVYVTSSVPSQLRNLYSNYFKNAETFTSRLDQAL